MLDGSHRWNVKCSVPLAMKWNNVLRASLVFYFFHLQHKGRIWKQSNISKVTYILDCLFCNLKKVSSHLKGPFNELFLLPMKCLFSFYSITQSTTWHIIFGIIEDAHIFKQWVSTIQQLNVTVLVVVHFICGIVTYTLNLWSTGANYWKSSLWRQIFPNTGHVQSLSLKYHLKLGCQWKISKKTILIIITRDDMYKSFYSAAFVLGVCIFSSTIREQYHKKWSCFIILEIIVRYLYIYFVNKIVIITQGCAAHSQYCLSCLLETCILVHKSVHK